MSKNLAINGSLFKMNSNYFMSKKNLKLGFKISEKSIGKKIGENSSTSRSISNNKSLTDKIPILSRDTSAEKKQFSISKKPPSVYSRKSVRNFDQDNSKDIKFSFQKNLKKIIDKNVRNTKESSNSIRGNSNKDIKMINFLGGCAKKRLNYSLDRYNCPSNKNIDVSEFDSNVHNRSHDTSYKIPVKNIWHEKINFKYHLEQQRILNEKWTFEEILNSLKIMSEIDELDRVSPIKHSKDISKDFYCLKFEIEEVLERVSEQMKCFTKNNSENILNDFKKTIKQYTTQVRSTVQKFQKSGYLFLSQSIQYLWVMFSQNCDKLIQNFGKDIASKYKAKNCKLEKDFENFKMEMISEKTHIKLDNEKLTTELRLVQSQLQNSEKIIQDLKNEVESLTKKIEVKKLNPEEVSEKCNKLIEDIESNKLSFSKINVENTCKNRLIENDFKQQLSTCKRQNFLQKNQQSTSDQKLSEFENLTEKISISDTKLTAQDLLSVVKNCCIDFLTEFEEKRQSSKEKNKQKKNKKSIDKKNSSYDNITLDIDKEAVIQNFGFNTSDLSMIKKNSFYDKNTKKQDTKVSTKNYEINTPKNEKIRPFSRKRGAYGQNHSGKAVLKNANTDFNQKNQAIINRFDQFLSKAGSAEKNPKDNFDGRYTTEFSRQFQRSSNDSLYSLLDQDKANSGIKTDKSIIQINSINISESKKK